ncbi:kinase-like domain-containing protein [Cercophora scortea]|uniref:Kinase-like domain-containing protein n=1 Tax=Cercophora scortea TaxID=314031 RepID=A0AAE0I3K0_9PEZI|nr:kinase-like domain-containing protein [Cercophora scortea]
MVSPTSPPHQPPPTPSQQPTPPRQQRHKRSSSNNNTNRGDGSRPTSDAAERFPKSAAASKSMPTAIEEDDPMLDYPAEEWIKSMMGKSGLLYRFSESLVYKSNVTPREADLMEAAGDLTLRPRTRVIWKGSRPATGTKAIIMEYGKRFKPKDIPPNRRRNVVLEMFVLVEKLHGQRGIVHGDIKQSNFLWGRDGHLKLADFGSARFIEENPDSWNSSYATEAYFTPERMRKRDSHGNSGMIPAPTVFDDYYALAVTLWGFFTGKTPEDGQFNQKNIKKADVAEVDDDLVRRWIRKVFRMAGCRFI